MKWSRSKKERKIALHYKYLMKILPRWEEGWGNKGLGLKYWSFNNKMIGKIFLKKYRQFGEGL